MQIIVSLVISALMVLGGVVYTNETKTPSVGASQTISSLTELTSLSHNDVFPITEVNGLTTKKVKWGTATSSLKVINDALYSPIIGSASITTLGTITTGTWNADTIAVSKGGTGSTSLIAYQLLAGNGTGAVTTFGNGASGYVLTSNGAGSLPSFQNVGVTTNNNNTWTGTNTFTATTTFSAPTFGANVYVQYLASTTINGGTAPKAVFVATSTNALWNTDASSATTSDFLGFAIENRVNGGTTTVQIDGVVNGFSGLTAGASYYASTTGVLSTVYNAGTAEIYVGRAVSATQLLLDRKGDSWQYLGSATCAVPALGSAGTVSCDTSSITFARFAIVQTSIIPNTGGNECVTSFIVSKTPTDTTRSSYSLQKQSTNIWECRATALFTSTSSVRFTAYTDYSSGQISRTQTAYFYR